MALQSITTEDNSMTYFEVYVPGCRESMVGKTRALIAKRESEARKSDSFKFPATQRAYNAIFIAAMGTGNPPSKRPKGAMPVFLVGNLTHAFVPPTKIRAICCDCHKNCGGCVKDANCFWCRSSMTCHFGGSNLDRMREFQAKMMAGGNGSSSAAAASSAPGTSSVVTVPATSSSAASAFLQQKGDSSASSGDSSTNSTSSGPPARPVGGWCMADADCLTQSCDVMNTYGCHGRCTVAKPQKDFGALVNCPNMSDPAVLKKSNSTANVTAPPLTVPTTLPLPASVYGKTAREIDHVELSARKIMMADGSEHMCTRVEINQCTPDGFDDGSSAAFEADESSPDAPEGDDAYDPDEQGSSEFGEGGGGKGSGGKVKKPDRSVPPLCLP
jgi:hypothetical protein